MHPRRRSRSELGTQVRTCIFGLLSGFLLKKKHQKIANADQQKLNFVRIFPTAWFLKLNADLKEIEKNVKIFTLILDKDTTMCGVLHKLDKDTTMCGVLDKLDKDTTMCGILENVDGVSEWVSESVSEWQAWS